MAVVMEELEGTSWAAAVAALEDTLVTEGLAVILASPELLQRALAAAAVVEHTLMLLQMDAAAVALEPMDKGVMEPLVAVEGLVGLLLPIEMAVNMGPVAAEAPVVLAAHLGAELSASSGRVQRAHSHLQTLAIFNQEQT
jgi:hypothetical protein